MSIQAKLIVRSTYTRPIAKLAAFEHLRLICDRKTATGLTELLTCTEALVNYLIKDARSVDHVTKELAVQDATRLIRNIVNAINGDEHEEVRLRVFNAIKRLTKVVAHKKDGASINELALSFIGSTLAPQYEEFAR